MSEKSDAVCAHLIRNFVGGSVDYIHEGGFHKFRLRGQGPTHWLYIGEETFADSEAVILVNLINIYGVFESFKSATKSKWLYLGENQIREVDENFTKPR